MSDNSNEFNIKDVIKDNKVHFSFYRAGELYYNIQYDGDIYLFPVPIDDIGEATFNKEDKAIYFMRYIRKAMNNGTFVTDN